MLSLASANSPRSVFMNMGVTESANSISNFQPTILKGLGYTSIGAQLHTIPVYIVGAAVSVIFGYMRDYLGNLATGVLRF